MDLALAVYYLFINLLIFIGAKMRLTGLEDLLSIDSLSKTFHLHLFLQYLSKGILLLSAFHFAGLLELIVLILQSLKLFLVLNFFLTRAHKIHLETLSSVFDDALRIFGVVELGSCKNWFVLRGVEGWFLDEFVIQGLLLGVFKFDFVGVFLVFQFDRASLEVKHVVIF